MIEKLLSSYVHYQNRLMIKYIVFTTTLLLLITFSAYSYQPNDSIRRLPSRRYLNPDHFSMKKRPQYSIKKILIVIDAGHGGDDLGTHSDSDPKYHEKSLNLITARALNDFLQKMGYQTLMTRSKDEFIPLQQRAEFANERRADLFVSVHYNSAPAKKAEGVEVFYYKSDENKNRSTTSRKLASAILTHVTKITGAKSRGVKHGNFAVIRETSMPAVLVEGGFLTNENEMDKIKEPSYVKNVAWGIARGIQTFLNDK